MKYRKLGTSDLELSTVTFGAWAVGGWMWGGTEQNESVKAMHAAFDAGVTSFDTAPVYGQGHSEKIVGKALKELPRYGIQILTKYGMRWDLKNGDFAMTSQDNNGNEIDIYNYAAKDSVIKECEESLRRLQTDYIDLYQIHWPDSTTPIAETMEAIAQLKKEGKIREAAVCNYNVDQLKEASKHVDIISDQVPYSMLKRGIEEEVVPYCLDSGKGILAYSPLQRGLLTGKMQPGQKFGEGDGRANSPFYTDENIRRTNTFLDEIKPIAENHDATLAQLTIQWTLQQPGITIALVGARNPEQAAQNAAAADLELSDNELGKINNERDKLELDLD
jgi:aryl-alcohol dehydrogenase-like predicted oxidoreductase